MPLAVYRGRYSRSSSNNIIDVIWSISNIALMQ